MENFSHQIPIHELIGGSQDMTDHIIPIHKPYDFNMVLAFLERHAAYGIEEVKNEYYYRYIPYGNSYGTVKVTIDDEVLCVSMSGCIENDEILSKIKQLFDADHDPGSLPKPSGVRVVGCFNPYEVAISIILGQLVSIQQATQKLEQLIRLFGKRVENKIHSFPSPRDLMNKNIEKIGITKMKAAAIRSLSERICTKEFRFSNDIDFSVIEKQLLSIKGVGPWTTQMIMMRCFSYKDAFPKNDLFIQQAIEKRAVDESSWHSNRAYLAHYIWGKAARQLSLRRRAHDTTLSKN